VTAVSWTVVLCLTFLVLLSLVLQFAIIRRQREIEERLAGRDLNFPQVGKRIGPFAVDTVNGDTVTHADLAGRTRTVAVLEPGCAPCQRLSQELRAGHAVVDPLILVVASPDRHEGRELADSLKRVGDVAMVAPDSATLDAVGGITGFPTLLLVEDGRVEAAAYRLANLGGSTLP